MAKHPKTIGRWSEIKLQILREYGKAYLQILRKQAWCRGVGYIDGFAGRGSHISRERGDPVQGSPAIALNFENGFDEYHFVDLDGQNIEALRELGDETGRIFAYHGDCNAVLRDQVLPRFSRTSQKRALCLLDPYNLNPSWNVISNIGEAGTMDLLMNFMVMDIKMNMALPLPEDIPQVQANRMTRFWGSEGWKEVLYRQEPGLFGEVTERESEDKLVHEYCRRLHDVAGFKYVADFLPVRNSKNATMYYLLFASNSQAGTKIVGDIFKKWAPFVS
jgi:three-Cys-motif partner protein